MFLFLFVREHLDLIPALWQFFSHALCTTFKAVHFVRAVFLYWSNFYLGSIHMTCMRVNIHQLSLYLNEVINSSIVRCTVSAESTAASYGPFFFFPPHPIPLWLLVPPSYVCF